MKCVIAARSTENSADSCANDDVILNADYRHIFSMLEICNKRNKLFFKKLKVFYPMHMLVFFPHALITAHPIDIHLGAFPHPPPRLLQPPRLFTLRLFSNPPAYCHPPFYSGLESKHKQRARDEEALKVCMFRCRTCWK